MLQLDQLLKYRATHDVLKCYQEGGVMFLPTYKYGINHDEINKDSGTDVFDTSKKMRIPSWCDRILYQNPSGGEI